MCGGRDHPPAAPSGRAVFLRGVETGGLGRRVDGDPRGLVAGRAQDRHGAGRVRVGRGHGGVLTEEDGEVARAAAAVVWAVEMRPALKATVMRVDVVDSRAGMGPGGIAAAGARVTCAMRSSA